MRRLSAALGYNDESDGQHFILDEETVYNELSSLEVQNTNGAESSTNESHKLNMHGTPTFNRFSCLDSLELAPGNPYGAPPGLSEP
eukprot:11867624-Heterocapsa_arctica.AAC.1